MKRTITRAKAFGSGCEGIAQAENALIEEEFEEQKNSEKVFKPKVTKVSDDLKFGRGKRSVAEMFNKRQKEKQKQTA